MNSQKQNGFTIVELLIVIVVIGILAAITIVAYNGVQDRAKVSRVAHDLQTFTNVFAQYYADNGTYPCFDHSYSDTKEITWSKPYIKWPKTPWNTSYHWEINYGSGYGGGDFAYSVSIQSPGQYTQALDNVMDDGNLATGKLRGNTGRLEYGGMDQSIPMTDCAA